MSDVWGVAKRLKGGVLAATAIAASPTVADANNFTCQRAEPGDGGHCYATANTNYAIPQTTGTDAQIEQGYQFVPSPASDFVTNEIWFFEPNPANVNPCCWIETGAFTGYSPKFNTENPSYFSATAIQATDSNGNPTAKFVSDQSTQGPPSGTTFEVNIHKNGGSGPHNYNYDVAVNGTKLWSWGSQQPSGSGLIAGGLEETDTGIYSSGNVFNVRYYNSSGALTPAPLVEASDMQPTVVCGRVYYGTDQYFVTTQTYGGSTC